MTSILQVAHIFFVTSFHLVRVLLSVQVVTEAQTAGSAAISLQPTSARCTTIWVQSVSRNYCKVAVYRCAS